MLADIGHFCVRLQRAIRVRELARFDLWIDSKLREIRGFPIPLVRLVLSCPELRLNPRFERQVVPTFLGFSVRVESISPAKSTT